MPGRPRSTKSTSRGASDPSPLAPDLLEAAFSAVGGDGLLRVLARAALEPATLGADVAHALRWDAATEWFEPIARLRATQTLGVTDWIDRHPEPRAAACDLDALDSLSRDAWVERRATAGVGPAPGLLWSSTAARVVFPVRTRTRDVGLLVVELAAPEAPAPERIDAFARWLSIAAEGWDVARERERRAGHAAGVTELTRVALAPRNIAEVLHAVSRLATDHTRSHGAAVWVADATGALALQVSHGSAGSRERAGRALHPVACAAAESGRPRVACPATDELLLPAEAAADLAAAAVLPVIAYGRAVGALAVWREHASIDRGTLEPEDLEYLAELAGILGLALEQSRRSAQLKDAERRARDAARYARQRDALATLGEMGARASQESLKPAASIRAFASRLLKTLPEDEPGREYVEIIQREVERLERILREQHAHAELPPPAFQIIELNGVVDGALQAVGETLVRRRARVLKRLASDLPPLLLDPRGIEHVTSSLLRFALDSIAVGGRVRIETRRLPQHVLFELGHDGAHVPGEAIDQLFLPFGGGGSAGAGLSVAHRIIEQHGGELRVRADGEWTTVVTFTLPIVGNQDRRRKPRRVPRDRRQVAAAG